MGLHRRVLSISGRSASFLKMMEYYCNFIIQKAGSLLKEIVDRMAAKIDCLSNGNCPTVNDVQTMSDLKYYAYSVVKNCVANLKEMK